MTPRGAFGFGLDLLLAVALWFCIASMKRVHYVKGVTSNLHWSINARMTVETEAESMDKGTEQSEAEGVTRRGIGFGNVRSKSDGESRNARGPK